MSDDSKFNCGHGRSQHLEDSTRGRPNSPKYNLVDEVATYKECVCSNPSGFIGVRG